jgi:transglutaminase-like putative cysteine protease
MTMFADNANRVIAGVDQQFQYETGATRLDSKVDDILARRAGVCHDLAHLAIGVLRLVAVPARYVSGISLRRRWAAEII